MMLKMTMVAALLTGVVAMGVTAGDAAKLKELEAKLTAIETECQKAGRALGEADAHGEYVLTEEGEKAEAIRREIAALCEKNPELAKGNERAKWGLRPLGKPGTLKLPTEFVNKPAFAAVKPFRPGMTLVGQGRKCTIFAPTEKKAIWALADEFAWHMSEMTGEKFKLQDSRRVPVKGGPYVVFADETAKIAELGGTTGEVSKVKTVGNTLVIAGRGTSGVSHATTHVLEALGCRYLWPGKSGKVIPKKSEVVLPADIDFEFTPKFKVRGVRDYGEMSKRIEYSLRRLGFEPEAAFARHHAVRKDREGNRGFWLWHGVNDTPDVEGFSSHPGRYVWGHYFGDYVERYGKDHPEWFALQRDGTRDMSKVGERPTFCLSNPGLAKETARDLVAKFKSEPDKIALSACLPDGGPTAQCMCPDCRRLDPVNGLPKPLGKFPYVSRTDRVFTFVNRIAADVTAELPDKRLCFYAYSDYEDPPAAVKPHPALVIFAVAGEYTMGKAHDKFQRILAGWSSFGNEMFWRPNVLRCFQLEVPQDFSRLMFEDAELCKANNFIGTDFDCMDNQWSTRGLTFYMAAKGLLNPRRIGYDDLLDDYCRAGYGAAADAVKAYYAYLAETSAKVASVNEEYRGGARKYLDAIDLDRADGLLAEAMQAAGDDADVRHRLELLQLGIAYARHNKRIFEAQARRDRNVLQYQKEFLAFIHDCYEDDDKLAVMSVAGMGFYNAAVRGALNDLEKNPPAADSLIWKHQKGLRADEVGPLGEPGHLEVRTEFANKPTFETPKPFVPGLVLVDGKRQAAVYAPKGNRALWKLADEFAYHLSKMTGRQIPVVDTLPATGAAVVFGGVEEAKAFDVDFATLKGEASVVKTKDGRVFVGGVGAGASHALTYVLEALGCRYLWPGESGKVIPKKSVVAFPKDIDRTFTPQLVLRGVRSDTACTNFRTAYALRRLGFDPSYYASLLTKASCDRKGNRGFWQWHGVNDTASVAGYSATPGAYEWGHYFGDYIKRYGKAHPEWFALQPDGTRDTKGVHERPEMCLSNDELARETARNLIEKFKARPEKVALSVCLPDGGPCSPCLCENCRRLDPENVKIGRCLRSGRPVWALTDRVLTFANRVLGLVQAECPGKRLTWYAYNQYEKPPVRVKPHEGLIIFATPGCYSEKDLRTSAQEKMAGWATFGNELFWRPNALRYFNYNLPQNFGRLVFNDLELFKANNLIGTDFDCMNGKYAIDTLPYYATAKAHINVERLSYDDLFDDFCRTGFGKAAGSIRKYFELLERETDRVAENPGLVTLRDGRTVGNGANTYMKTLDLDGLEAFLDEANAAAAGDAEVLRRIRFLRYGIDIARQERTCSEAQGSRDQKRSLECQRAFLRYCHETAFTPDALIAFNVSGDGFYNSRLRGALIEREKTPPKGGAVERVAASDDGRDRTMDLNRAIDLVRLAGGGTVELEKGAYRFDAKKAFDLKFFISNHDQSSEHPVLFPILGATNIVIRGNGSKFLVDGEAIPFYIRDSKNVSIEGIEMDAVHPVMTEARIEGFSDGKTVVRAIGNGRCSPVGSAIVFDSRNGGIVPQSGDVPYKGAMKELDDGRLELAYDFSRVGTGAKVGDIVVLRPPNRPTPALVIENSADTVLTDVIVHDAHGMALVAQHSENIAWRGTGSAADRRSGVFPSKGRVSSTHADATHFSNVKGRVRVENCLFEGMMDDAINVHSTSLAITKVLAPNRILCQFKHFQAYGFDVFLPGEKVRFIRGTTLENGPVMTVREVAKPRVNEVELTLDGLIPAGYAVGDAVENADYQPTVSFVGNIVRNNRARAALFTTSRPVVCASNLFARVSGSAVLLAGDAQKWYESGACTDVAVFGNVFSNCCASAKCHGYCKGVISVCPTVSKIAEQKVRYHRNLRVTDNTFYTFDVPLLYACSAENIVFKGNRIRRNDDFAGWDQPTFVIERCAKVRTEE